MSRSFLKPKVDLVFRMLFGNPENQALLVSLLNAVLRPPSPIAAVIALTPEPALQLPVDKPIVLDLRVQLADGQQVDVEMQTRSRPALRMRALYYWAKLYAGQLVRGDGYDKLRRSVVILILDFEELAGARFHSCFRTLEVRDGEELSDQLEIHVIELPKLGLALTQEGEQELSDWGRFLSAETDTDLAELAMTDPIFREAKEALERLSADPRARVLAEQREMALLSEKLDLAEAREQGARDVLRRLFVAKFGAIPEAVLPRITAASVAELERLAERVLTADTLDGVFDR